MARGKPTLKDETIRAGETKNVMPLKDQNDESNSIINTINLDKIITNEQYGSCNRYLRVSDCSIENI